MQHSLIYLHLINLQSIYISIVLDKYIFIQNDTNEEKAEVGDNDKKVMKKKMFQCEICQSLLSRKSHLERHILRKHTQEKKLKCDFCGKGFVELHDLKSHEKVHIGQEGYLAFKELNIVYT